MKAKQNKIKPSRENGLIMGMIMGVVLGVLLAGGTGHWWWVGISVGLCMIIGIVADRIGRENNS